jgi:predicted ATPase/DNA-binding CsgD family transcriptional regulator
MEFGSDGLAGHELNAFVGRERELTELRQVAAGTRALTLCGAGGIGKTRLAVHLAAGLAAGFGDGAWFVGLADLREPELVASRIAAELGVVEEPGRPLLATLADALRPRQTLIVLDNCEHLIDACAQVCQRLLASAPGLRVITTSREPLRVAAETVWQVPPMAMPSQPEPLDPRLPDYDAVRLFADRASAVKPDFTLGPANLAATAAICRAVDGLPLAIELAAAWVGVLTVEQIATRLGDRFRLLSSASRMTPQRHRTLSAAIDWSHDLLTEPEKILLRRLSVFAGWPLDMAEQVCASDGEDAEALPPGDVLDLLTGLADKSLVIAEPDAQGEFRYRMLDTIRDYAAARLAEAGETELMRARFLGYAVAEVEELARIGMALVPAPWAVRVRTFRRFGAEAANVRQLLSWCLAAGDAESGLRICACTRPVWIVQGSFAEGMTWMDRFLALGVGLPASVLGPALVGRAQLALAIDHAEAARRARAGLGLCREPGLEFWAASALNLLAEVALKLGQTDEAEKQAAEAMDLATGSGDGFNAGYAAGTRAAVAAYRGDLDGALRLGETALAITREIDQQWAVARTLLGLGDLARLTGDPVRARQHYGEALAILREVNARPEMARCLAGLGRIEISQGELVAASKYFAESLELSRATGSRIGVIRGLDSFATLAMAQRRPERAVELTAAAAALRSAAHLPEPPAGRTERLLSESGLGDAAIKELWEAGSELSGDAAVELALEPVQLAESAAPSAEDLTARELEVAAAIARGLGNRAIASELGIAPATVARHVANIMAKLDFSSRTQIASWAASRGY